MLRHAVRKEPLGRKVVEPPTPLTCLSSNLVSLRNSVAKANVGALYGNFTGETYPTFSKVGNSKRLGDIAENDLV